MVNMLVLTHKDMRLNPINIILTGIAVADCLVMVEYIPFNLHMYLLDDQMRVKEEKVRFTNLKQIPNAKPYDLMLWLNIWGEVTFTKCHECRNLQFKLMYKSGSEVMGGWVSGGAVVAVRVAVWVGWKSFWKIGNPKS